MPIALSGGTGPAAGNPTSRSPMGQCARYGQKKPLFPARRGPFAKRICEECSHAHA
jgi:hypothetical protein